MDWGVTTLALGPDALSLLLKRKQRIVSRLSVFYLFSFSLGLIVSF